MAKAMRRDAGKERYWRGVVARWRQSGLGVRDFCFREDLSEASFYSWRRELLLREREAAGPKAGRQLGAGPLFVPVRVEGDGAGEPIRIFLADGAEVRVGVGFDSRALKRVLAVLKELRADAEGSSC